MTCLPMDLEREWKEQKPSRVLGEEKKGKTGSQKGNAAMEDGIEMAK